MGFVINKNFCWSEKKVSVIQWQTNEATRHFVSKISQE